jgi:hypothetical protein
LKTSTFGQNIYIQRFAAQANILAMSDEIKNTPPSEKPETPAKPAAKKPGPKSFGNPFLGNNKNFNSSKAGNPSNRGKSFKGGGVKKGK